jgi:hypothetical protein
MMMLNAKKRIVVICATGLLAACGGGGGGGGNGAAPVSMAPMAPAAPSSPAAPAPAAPAANVDFSPIAGLYDISDSRDGVNDAAYLFITDRGAIEVYNDLGDDFAGAGRMNCFRRAMSGDVSFRLDAKQFQRTADTFQTTLTAMELGQSSDQTLSLTLTATGFQASFSGITSRTGDLRIQSGSLGILKTAGTRTTALSIETIRAMICQ